MRKKSIFVFLLLAIFTIVVAVWFYRFAEWYAQTMGEIFSYIVIISFSLFVFAPLKFIKDKKANISIVNYVKYFGVSIFALVRIVTEICKEVIVTASYIFTRFFVKGTQIKQEIPQTNQDTQA